MKKNILSLLLMGTLSMQAADYYVAEWDCQGLPPGPLLDLYSERVTVLPPLIVGLMFPSPPNISVPSLTVTPELMVGFEEAETTNLLPPLEGVLKA